MKSKKQARKIIREAFTKSPSSINITDKSPLIRLKVVRAFGM
jgi:hypothetical protein